MKIKIYIKNSKETITIDAFSIPKILQDDDFWEYNTTLGKCYKALPQVFKNQMSVSLTAVEQQTYLFESINHHFYILSKIAEKNTLEIENISLLNLLTLTVYLNKHKIKYKLSNISLKNLIIIYLPFLIFLKRFFHYLIKEIKYVFLCQSLKVSKQNVTVVIRDYFDYRNITDSGEYRSEFFGELYKVYASDSLVLSSCLDTQNLPLYIKYLKSNKKNILFTYSILNYSQIFLYLIRGVFSKVTLSNKVFFKGRDIQPIINISLFLEYINFGWKGAYQEFEVMRSLESLVTFEKLIYPYENHPWEKAINLYKSQKKKPFKTTGFQHSSFSTGLLQHFPSQFHYNRILFPDKIVTTGEIPKKILNRRGHYECPIQVGVGLRQHKNIDKTINRPRSFTKECAFAFSYETRYLKQILEQISLLFENTGINVYLKFHPLHIREAQSIFSDLSLSSELKDATGIDWKYLFQNIDFLLYEDTTLGIEVMHYGIPSFLYLIHEPIYNIDRLYCFSKNKHNIASIDQGKCIINDFYKEKLNIEKEYLKHYFNQCFSLDSNVFDISNSVY